MTPDKSKANFLYRVERGGNRSHIRAPGLAGESTSIENRVVLTNFTGPASYLMKMGKESMWNIPKKLS